MKKLITIMMMMMVIPLFANDVTTDDMVTITETERIIDKYTEKAGAVIHALADQLAVPVEHVYQVLVTQSIVSAISLLILLILGLVMIYTSSKLLSYNITWRSGSAYIRVEDVEDLKNIKYTDKNITLEFYTRLIIAMLGTFMSIIATINIEDIIGGLINPEYKAIHDIVQLIGAI